MGSTQENPWTKWWTSSEIWDPKIWDPKHYVWSQWDDPLRLEWPQITFRASFYAGSRPKPRYIACGDNRHLWRTFGGPRAVLWGLAHFCSLPVTPVANQNQNRSGLPYIRRFKNIHQMIYIFPKIFARLRRAKIYSIWYMKAVFLKTCICGAKICIVI